MFLLLRVFPAVSQISKFLANRTRHPKQNALLRRIVDRIRNSLELQVVLQTAVDEIATCLELDRCVFFWHFKELDQIHIVCEYDCHDQRVSQLGQYPLAQFGAANQIARGEVIINQGKVLSLLNPRAIFQELAFWQRRSPQSDSLDLQLLGASASLFMPVKQQEDSLGYIACLSDQPRRWSGAEVELIQSIAQQLEIAIRQAQLYEQTQKQAKREKLVNQITSQTRQSFDLDTILTQAIAHLLEALEIDRCLVHLVEDLNAKDLELNEENPEQSFEDEGRYSFQRPSQEVSGAVYRRNHLFEVYREPLPPSINDFDTNGPITQWVIQHRQQVVISDITQDCRIGPDNTEYQLAQIKSSLVVPAQANSSLQAILYLNQCSQVRYWSRDDQKLAQAVADQLAISIKQGHLYAQTQQQAIESAAQAKYLATTLQKLRLTQAQLIQSEKMSSLGQMVAGVAHEINNPVSFIYGNVPYVERYIQDLIRLLKAYQVEYPCPSNELRETTEEIELDFLMQDLPHILCSMRSGAERIREIVLSLRNFSRLDEARCKAVDIHDGLRSTLSVLKSHLDKDIKIVEQFGELPLVECYPMLLNQVFMNLIMNAIEVLRQQTTTNKAIILTTDLIANELTQEPWVRVTIADNGPGIPYSIQSKIFDPFFTTKEIGKGAGLGLTVSYQTIVNQHQGRLDYHSEPGQGAKFIIEIPVKHPGLLKHSQNFYLPESAEEALPMAKSLQTEFRSVAGAIAP